MLTTFKHTEQILVHSKCKGKLRPREGKRLVSKSLGQPGLKLMILSLVDSSLLPFFPLSQTFSTLPLAKEIA